MPDKRTVYSTIHSIKYKTEPPLLHTIHPSPLHKVNYQLIFQKEGSGALYSKSLINVLFGVMLYGSHNK
jgi:hypothetical protein